MPAEGRRTLASNAFICGGHQPERMFAACLGPLWPGGMDSAIPWANVAMRGAASATGSRKVPVQASPCQKEITIVESNGWVETPMRRAGLRVSWNQTLSPKRWLSASTRESSRRLGAFATGSSNSEGARSDARVAASQARRVDRRSRHHKEATDDSSRQLSPLDRAQSPVC